MSVVVDDDDDDDDDVFVVLFSFSFCAFLCSKTPLRQMSAAAKVERRDDDGSRDDSEEADVPFDDLLFVFDWYGKAADGRARRAPSVF